MRLGISAGYSGSTINLPMEMIKEADRLGYFAVWTAEAYGSDAVTPLAWIGAQTERIHLGSAVMQMPARTPAMTAMTAITLDQLSGGRMLLGLGLSGPQVVEGWHGQPYGRPLGKTREYVGILRDIFAREAPVVHSGAHYQIPYQGEDATGLGKPLKSIIHGRVDLPIYLAAIGPGNVRLTAELADGWLPVFFSPTHYDAIYRSHVEAGFARAGHGKALSDFDIAPTVQVVLGSDVDACRATVKPILALYVGGMGARGKNFYFDLVCRYGFEDAAHAIQDLYLQGKKVEAISMVPDELVDEVALCGPRERIAERLTAWDRSPITTLNISTFDPEAVRVMAELVLGERSKQSVHPVAAMADEELAETEPIVTPVAQSAAIFAAISDRVDQHPDLVRRVNAIFQFHITGEPGGDWYVDLRNSPAEVQAGLTEGADCTISVHDNDFVELANGRLNPMAAFAQGKVKVQGNIMMATRLQALFS